MEKLKQYKYIILILLVVLGFLFYWYEFRPSQIKKECFTEAGENARDLLKTKKDELKKDFDDYYKNCLRKRGL